MIQRHGTVGPVGEIKTAREIGVGLGERDLQLGFVGALLGGAFVESAEGVLRFGSSLRTDSCSI